MNRGLLAVVLLLALSCARAALAQETPPGQPADDPGQPAGAPSPAGSAAPGVAPVAPAPVVAPEAAPLADSLRDAAPKHRPFTLSTMAYIPWWYGVGIGAKVGFEIPIVHNGFIPKINDSFSLEPSFSFAYSRWSSVSDLNALRFQPAISALWSFYFSEKLRAYAAINLGYSIVSFVGESQRYRYLSNGSYFYGEASVGLFYQFAGKLSARAEIGWQGLRGGLAFAF